VKPIINNPDKFAKWFNSTVQGAYRQLTVQEAHDMTHVGLIGLYGGYYLHSDLETVRKLLQLEQLQQNRQVRSEIKDEDGTLHCKRCHVVLPDQPNGQVGRPREYCDSCESARTKERHCKWRDNKQKAKQKLLSCTIQLNTEERSNRDAKPRAFSR